MARQRLTNKLIENLEAGSDRIEVWDTVIGDDESLSGAFGIRVAPGGKKTWQVMYRVLRPDGRRKQRRIALGNYPAISLSAAREQAREILKQAGRGEDHVETKKRAQSEAAGMPTLAEGVEQFIEGYAKKRNRSWEETNRVFQRHVLPGLGDRKMDEVTRKDVLGLLNDIVRDGHPYMANRVLAALRKLYNWHLEQDTITASPAANIKAPGTEVARDRVLTDEEIAAVWDAFDKMGWPFGHAFKLLLVTGQRLREVTTMKWEHLDLEKAIWTQPREVSKSDRAHEVPLSQLALEILDNLPRQGDYVFTTNGKTPISGFSKAKARCDKLSGVTDWRLHDLRRTAASGMAKLKVRPWVVEKVLNHQSGQISGVAGVYNRYGYLDEKREALELWGKKINQTLPA